MYKDLENVNMLIIQGSLVRRAVAFLRGATARKGVLSLADQGVRSATMFLTGVIIGRSCARQELGLYMLGFSIVLFLITLQEALITTPYTAKSPLLERSARARYAGSTLIHQSGLSVLIIGLLTAAGALLADSFREAGVAAILWVLAGTITPMLLREYARRVSFAHLHMMAGLVLDSSVAFIQIGGLLILTYLDALSASRAFLLAGLACGLGAVGWFVWGRRWFIPRLKDAGRDLKDNLSFGKWLLASGLTWTGHSRIYPWLLAGFHGADAVGVLFACLGVAGLINPFLIGVENFLGPKAAHAFGNGGVIQLSRVVVRATLFLGAILSCFCLLILIFGESLVEFIYGDKFAQTGLVVIVLALSSFALGSGSTADCGLWVMERPEMNFKINLITWAMVATIGLWLVRSLGPLGTALGLLAGHTVASTVRQITFAHLARSAAGRQTK